jgi:hypothetical protein
MYVPRCDGRRWAAVTLALVLSTTAVHAAELTKDQCQSSRVLLGGAIYYRVAHCSTLDVSADCLQQVQAYYDTWNGALERAGCATWPSERDLFLHALEARLEPPPGFYDDCSREAGVCGGTCADFGHQCRDDGAGDCRCQPLEDFDGG